MTSRNQNMFRWKVEGASPVPVSRAPGLGQVWAWRRVALPEEVQAGGCVHAAGVLQAALSPKSPGTSGLPPLTAASALCRDDAAVGKPVRRRMAGPAPGHPGPQEPQQVE